MFSFRPRSTALLYRVNPVLFRKPPRSRPCIWPVSRPPNTFTHTPLHLDRGFQLESSGIATAPLVFLGLFVALWTWKCVMLVVLQNKIIFNPFIPPNARSETIEDYAKQCGGIRWREERLRASDGTSLALCVTDIGIGNARASQHSIRRLYVLYFQGNASSTPPRLPELSSVLNTCNNACKGRASELSITFVCLSYRGYWRSSGRASERGIRLDAAAALNWVSEEHQRLSGSENSSLGSKARPGKLMLWGQSIGSGIATNLAAEHSMPSNLELDSIVLETPFTSIRAMLEVIYPQKWLPYRHLWPFLRTHLDSYENLGRIAGRHGGCLPQISILEAGKDELVPAELSQKLFERSRTLGFPLERQAVVGAYHNDTMIKPEGRRIVAGIMARRFSNAFAAASRSGRNT